MPPFAARAPTAVPTVPRAAPPTLATVVKAPPRLPDTFLDVCSTGASISSATWRATAFPKPWALGTIVT